MAQYAAPIRDMQFVLHEVLDAESTLKKLPAQAELSRDVMDQVIEEGGKFCAEVLFPLNQVGDREGCKLDAATHEVKTPTGFKQAYQQFVAAGWPALSCDPAYGGQGLPHAMQVPFQEMMNSANQAWSMYPGLTHGAYQALKAHGTPEQKKLVLPKLVEGTWTGTMCLTEPHGGTDLGLSAARPSRRPTAATRSPGARFSSPPANTTWPRTSSTWCWRACRMHRPAPRASRLFLVPKLLIKPDGSLGARNANLRRDRAQDGYPRQSRPA